MSMEGLSLELYATSVPGQYTPGIRLDVATPAPQGYRSQKDRLKQFVKLIPTRPLESLELGGYMAQSLRTFKDATELKNPRVVEAADEDMPQALLPQFDFDDDGNEERTVLFPELNALHMQGVSMGCGCCADGPEDDSPLLYWWNKMIEERPTLGYGPNLLNVEDCTADWMSDMVKVWKARVKSVIWDGKDRAADEDEDEEYY